jgi:hypothetical protein
MGRSQESNGARATGSTQAQAETESCWKGSNHRRHEEAMGVEEGGSYEVARSGKEGGGEENGGNEVDFDLEHPSEIHRRVKRD